MLSGPTDTICAVASAPGSGERGVLRISGPDAFTVGARMLGQSLPAARSVVRGRVQDEHGGMPVSVLVMPEPASFTRENVLEVHLPGNVFLVDSALRCALRAGCRMAEPGEFIRRAFMNGRLDLTRVEGVLALIHAQDRVQRRAASALLFGGLQNRMDALRIEMESLRALCEASLDFDEADTGHVPKEDLLRIAEQVLHRLKEALTWETQRDTGAALPRVVLAGAPNAGKSTLFNRLTQRVGRGESQLVDANEGHASNPPQGMDVQPDSLSDVSRLSVPALVENVPGSTRDVLRGAWDVYGTPVLLADTAGRVELGLDQASEDRRDVTATGGGADPDGALEVERLAQRLSEAEGAVADCVLWVVHAGKPSWPSEDLAARAILVWNQVDQDGLDGEPPEARIGSFAGGFVAVSGQTGQGIDSLTKRVAGFIAGESSGGNWTRALGLRHKQALLRSAQQVELAMTAMQRDDPLDWVAEELRQGTEALDDISGRTTPEDLLTKIFSQFCLGK